MSFPLTLVVVVGYIVSQGLKLFAAFGLAYLETSEMKIGNCKLQLVPILLHFDLEEGSDHQNSFHM